MTGLTGLLRASLAGALLLCAIPSLAAPLCPADHIDEQVRVASMPDGDTLRLSDGRRVRLIGINTPEVAHDGRPAEPLAEEAHALLQRLVREADGRLGLRLGEGSGAATAVAILRLACALHADMATFDEAGVSDKT
jgi:endonuclease YncB( thermonuclease family)